MKKDSLGGRILKTVILPVSLFVIFGAISLITGNSFLTANMMVYLLKQSCAVICVAIAVGFHATSGGFDFAIGGIVYLACILGGNLAVKNGLGVAPMAVFIIVIAALLSLLEGVMYVTLRLRPIINSLIYVMLCEAVTQVVFNGRGFAVLTKPQYTWFLQMPQVLIVTGLILLSYWLILKYTKFGFNDRALANGQRIAVSFGVKERKNVLIRYFVVGFYLGFAGLMYIGRNYEVTAAMNMESAILMFEAALPNMIAITLARYSNRSVSVLMSVISMQIIKVGLVCMKVDSNLAQVISGVFVLIFVAYTTNLPRILDKAQRKRRNSELTEEFGKAAGVTESL